MQLFARAFAAGTTAHGFNAGLSLLGRSIVFKPLPVQVWTLTNAARANGAGAARTLWFYSGVVWAPVSVPLRGGPASLLGAPGSFTPSGKLESRNLSMPLYEYECSACHRRTEKIQKFSDPEITSCPHCGGVLTRVLSAPAFSLKGGGWYADGYGSAKPAVASAEGSASAAPASNGDAAPAGASATPAPSSTPAAASAPAPATTGASSADK